MKIATVLLSSEPVSIILRHRGIISVVSRKLMTSLESFFTKAPMTPKLVRRRYSNGRDLDVVFKKGYRNNGICAAQGLISLCSEVDWGRKGVYEGCNVGVPLRKRVRVSL